MRTLSYIFRLFILVSANVSIIFGADYINFISGPEIVNRGTTVSVEVSYVASTDRDILIIFQMNSSPWTQFGYERISVAAGSTTLQIPISIEAATPIANDIYKFSVSLLPGTYGGWHDRLDEKIAGVVSCTEAPADGGLDSGLDGNSDGNSDGGSNDSVEDELTPQKFITYPTEYSGALRNPMKGFRPDTYSNNFNQEYATITRNYLKWNELENHLNDTIDKIKNVCNQKWAGVEQYGIKVIPRVYLDWDGQSGNEYWPSDMTTGDYSSEQFKQRLVRLISRLGDCWDNDPRVAWVQMGIIGRWGEHHASYPTAEIQQLMGDAFTQAFQNKKFLVRHANEFTDYDVGVYWDSWAHIQQIDEPDHGAGIKALNNATDRWKIRPIEGEAAYNWGQSYIQPGNSPDDTLSDPVHREFLIDTIRDLHCSGLGWIADYNVYNPVVKAGAEEVQKAFGYRFVISSFSCDRRADPDGSLRMLFSVTNTGSAPFYEDWPLEFSLLNPNTGELVWRTLLNDVDIRQWLPGDDWDKENNIYLDPPSAYTVDTNIILPGVSQLPIGEYLAALAIVEPLGKTPSVRFAVNNYFDNGRHPFGKVGIGLDVSGSHFLDSSTFDDPMAGNRLSYSLQAPDSPVAINPGSDDDDDVDAPEFTSGPTAPSIAENSGASQAIYTAIASDVTSVTYTLKEVNDENSFTIDGATGVVTLIGDPDFESQSSYSFTVIATDGLDNSSEQAVTLLITDLEDNLVDTDHDGVVDTLDVHPGYDDTELNAYLSTWLIDNGYFTQQDFLDARIGSTAVDVSSGKATIILQIEQSDDNMQTWSLPVEGAIAVDLPVTGDASFFRIRAQ